MVTWKHECADDYGHVVVILDAGTDKLLLKIFGLLFNSTLSDYSRATFRRAEDCLALSLL